MTNHEMADQLELLAKLMDIHQENPFKSKSYAQAAFQLDRLPVDAASLRYEELEALKGIGPSAANKILELQQTGHLLALDEWIAKTPAGILELLRIKGIGPKKISVIWKELGIETPGELLYACMENRLIHFKGFGEKSQASIKEAVEFYLQHQDQWLYAQALPLVRFLTQILTDKLPTYRFEISGAFRRQCDVVDRLEWVTTCDGLTLKEGLDSLNEFEWMAEDEQTLHYRYNEKVPLVFYPCTNASFGERLFLTTGSTAFTEAWQQLYPHAFSERPFENEPVLFSQVNLSYIPPCLREETAIILKAASRSIPELIQVQDIKGIIHSHTDWSDGANTLEEMANACRDKGFDYLVVSDHSVSSFYANGLDITRIRKQQEAIDRLNEKMHPFRVFKSIECDILYDGQLDYEEEVLQSFDVVIASVHQHLNMTEEKAMKRLLTAIEHPCVDIIGHPSGRLLLSRKGYTLDYPVLFETCARHQVAVEINANPRRLDLDWRWIPQAIQKGVMLSVNPDAHQVSGMDDIQFGILSAQKGQLEARQNLSSFSCEEFEAYILKKRNR